MKLKIALSLALLSTVLYGTAFAESGFRQIDAMFSQINLTMNGQKADLRGDVMFYEGSIYVPLRSLSEALGAEVSWNGQTQTVDVDFTSDKTKDIYNASQKAMYQYLIMQNNAITAEFIAAFKRDDATRLVSNNKRYGELRDVAKQLGDEPVALLFDKMMASMQIVISGWDDKQASDYRLGWALFNDYAKTLNASLADKVTDLAKNEPK
ncbi:copper amine oxidase N-terminal domain-containing protein [Paenibacillus puerhi]|uniref:copper amine oxidase N-terminal domain-containing protein n=1 Tax=Paenibacillus puerhi TaxID=2692622 RepID=UPI0013590A5B|nr:copper amine oxidase N-terminal domain-containing protein [Paenibacillus puerhi]